MLQFSGNELQGGGLAGAVSTDQAHAFAGLDSQIGIAQNDVVTKCERELIETN